MASLDDELAEIAATEARLAARARGDEPPAEAYLPTAAEIKRSVEFARKAPNPYATTTIVIRTVRATSVDAPRRQATTSPQRRAATARRTNQGRDGPSSKSDDPPLAPRRRLSAAERRVLKIKIDVRRREIIAAGIQLTEADRALFADDVAEQQGVG
jgi:hypothetical protein